MTSAPIRVAPHDCPIGLSRVHEEHTWRQGFWYFKYSCMGFSQNHYELLEILKSGSAGTLTQEQAQAWLNKRKRA